MDGTSHNSHSKLFALWHITLIPKTLSYNEQTQPKKQYKKGYHKSKREKVRSLPEEEEIQQIGR